MIERDDERKAAPIDGFNAIKLCQSNRYEMGHWQKFADRTIQIKQYSAFELHSMYSFFIHKQVNSFNSQIDVQCCAVASVADSTNWILFAQYDLQIFCYRFGSRSNQN